MARWDRCECCDYSQDQGSSYAGVNPGQNGVVRMRPSGELLCDPCWGKPVQKSSLLDKILEVVDEDDEGTRPLSEL
jgi:hypothetical protein